MAATTYKQVSTYNIHNDVAFCILSKLSIKSLTRFTCVKKSWSLLFQNPNFMNMFRTNFFISNQDEGDDNTFLLLKESNREFSYHHSLCVLFGDRFEDKVKLDWPPMFKEDEEGELCIQILGSTRVNGILCLYEGFENDTTTILWNRANGAFKTIPPSLQPNVNIEFNCPPEAFGYDRIKDDYKVIRESKYPIEFEGNWIYVPDKDNSFWETDVHHLDMNHDYWEEEDLVVEMDDPFYEIYSLKSNYWRKFDGVNMSAYFQGKSYVNLNEFSHWLIPGNHMVSFDFINETFFTMTLPSDSPLVGDLAVLNGSVSFISNCRMMTYLNIWVLGELGVKESWTKLLVFKPITCFMRPIGVGKKSHIFFRKLDNQLACIDCSTQKIVEIEVERDLVCLQILIYQ